MKFLQWAKDGGEDSHVTGFYIVELKGLLSIVLLHFANGTREAFHSHAFDAITWIIRGSFLERMLDGRTRLFQPSVKPKVTRRTTFHKVESLGNTWALSFRGPWKDTWREFLPKTRAFVTLTHGRQVLLEAAA